LAGAAFKGCVTLIPVGAAVAGAGIVRAAGSFVGLAAAGLVLGADVELVSEDDFEVLLHAASATATTAAMTATAPSRPQRRPAVFGCVDII
jgi:hypothetical protein